MSVLLAACGSDRRAPDDPEDPRICAPEGEPIFVGRLPAGNPSVDLVWTGAGWVVVAGLGYAGRRLWTFHVDGATGAVTRSSEVLDLAVVDLDVAWSEESRVGLVTFTQGLRWIDGQGRPDGPVIATDSLAYSLQGGTTPIDGGFLYWSGGNSVGSELLERQLGRAVLAPRAAEISVTPLPDVFTARAQPIFAATGDGVVGISIGLERDEAFIAWHDRAGTATTTRRFNRFTAGVTGSYFAATGDAASVWLGREALGARDMFHVVDRIDRDGGMQVDLVTVEDSQWMQLAMAGGEPLLAWSVGVPDGPAATSRIGGEPVFFDHGPIAAVAGDPAPAVVVWQVYEGANELSLLPIRCGSE